MSSIRRQPAHPRTNALRLGNPRASTAHLLRHILEQPALVAAVRELPGEVLAKLIEHVGLEDAGELVALASTDQLAQVFDEDLWRASSAGGDESFRPERFGVWLHVLSEAGDAFVAERLAALPIELLVLAVHRLVLVLDLDALAVDLSEAGEDSAYTEKALESVLFEEWEEFRLIARDHGSWDVLWAALLCLDRDHHGLLREVVERCAALDAEFIEENGGLYDVLTSEEMLEGDLAAERSDRRAERGHVAPADARAFLKLAKTGEGPVTRDPITMAYFRELSRKPVREATIKTRADASRGLNALAQLLADAKVTEEPGHTSALLMTAGSPVSSNREPDLLRAALAELLAAQPELAAQRLEELAYLSNVLIAGSTHLGRRPRPVEALESAVRSCGVGLEQALGDVRFAGPDLSGLSPVASLLARTSLDLLFRLASAKGP